MAKRHPDDDSDPGLSAWDRVHLRYMAETIVTAAKCLASDHDKLSHAAEGRLTAADAASAILEALEHAFSAEAVIFLRKEMAWLMGRIEKKGN